MAVMPIKLIVGLGNPGPEYAQTRHNVGVWFAGELLDRTAAVAKPESKFFGSVAKAQLDGHTVRVLLPATYMNESGRSVLAVAQFFKIRPEEILVVHDDLDHDPGAVRLKFAGGHGGHNGLRHIAQVLGSGDFARLRLGIGHPGDKSRVTGYVLKPPSKKDAEVIDHSIRSALDVVPDLLDGNWDKAVRTLHGLTSDTK